MAKNRRTCPLCGFVADSNRPATTCPYCQARLCLPCPTCKTPVPVVDGRRGRAPKCQPCRARPSTPSRSAFDPERGLPVAAGERWLAGETYTAIAADYGVSREWVRQTMLARYGSGIVRLVQARNKARTRAREYAKHGLPRARCAVCGAVVTKGRSSSRYSFCPTHFPMRWAVETMINERRHASHQAIVRRGLGCDTPTYSDRRWSGKARRWTVPGSRMHTLVREAIDKGWPLVERLPDDIFDQHRQEMAHRSASI